VKGSADGVNRWRLGRALLGAVAALLACAAFAPAFGAHASDALADPSFVGAIAGAVATITVTCVCLWAGTALVPALRVVAALAALVGYVILVVAPGWTVARGPKLLLTTALPIEPGGPELATVVLAAGLVALCAVEPALRGGAAVAQVAGPILVAGLGCAVSASAGPPPGWLAPTLAVCAAGILMLVRYEPSTSGRADHHAEAHDGSTRRRRRTRTTAVSLFRLVAFAVIAVMLTSVALAGWYGPRVVAGAGRQTPVDARDLVVQPVEPRESTSPLSLFPALRSGRKELSLTVRASRAPELLRYASLDHFTGSYWTTQAQYRRAGRWLPSGPDTSTVDYRDERIRVLEPGVLGWLVSSGRPVELTESGLGVDEITGDVVIPNDHTVPREYGVRSAVLVVEESTLDGATPAAAQGDPAIADDLKLWARQAAGGQGGHRALRQLEEHLRSYELDASAKPTGGHGVYQVRQLHLSRRGTAEQYASAFALLARALGFHTRVVVGFRPRHVARDEYAVTGKDVHAWAEVRFDGIGWVPYDPTPSRIWTGTPEGTEAQDRATPAPAASAAPAATSGPSAQGPSAAPGHGDPAWPALALVLAASAVVYVGAVGTAKAALRWRRRRVPSPRWRTLYAWRDTPPGR
jgi:transglutaminase-like putative cysteine protease